MDSQSGMRAGPYYTYSVHVHVHVHVCDKFAEGSYTAKFVKVFIHKSYQLYGIYNVHV